MCSLFPWQHGISYLIISRVQYTLWQQLLIPCEPQNGWKTLHAKMQPHTKTKSQSTLSFIKKIVITDAL
jgi:hypothetical protein